MDNGLIRNVGFQIGGYCSILTALRKGELGSKRPGFEVLL